MVVVYRHVAEEQATSDRTVQVLFKSPYFAESNRLLLGETENFHRCDHQLAAEVGDKW